MNVSANFTDINGPMLIPLLKDKMVLFSQQPKSRHAEMMHPFQAAKNISIRVYQPLTCNPALLSEVLSFKGKVCAELSGDSFPALLTFAIE